jgi:O-antigen ligase
VTGLERVASIVPALLPGATIVYLSFNSGGFFPGTPAFVLVVLLLALIARTIVAERPFDGLSRTLAVVLAALGGFALWTLASTTWSDSSWRTLADFDRALLYAVTVALFGSLVVTREQLVWLVRGVVLGLCVVCFSGLITRLLPEVWEVAPNITNNRLSYPVGYWNALGLMAGMAIVLCLGFTCRARGAVAPRILGAAAIPALATTLYLTFSRGSIIATIAGVAAFAVVARPRGFISGVLAVAPTTAIALVAAYAADELATDTPATPRGVDQGQELTLVLVACILAAAALRAALVYLDRRLARPTVLVAPRTARIASASAALVALLIFVVAGGPGWTGDQWDRFTEPSSLNAEPDLRERLTDFANNGRIHQWNVTFDSFERERLHGTGAGTFQFEWERDRPVTLAVVDAHALYFEALSELGVVGLLILLAAILAALGGVLWRARGPDRVLYGAIFAAGLTWALGAGVDWHWEMPAVTVAFWSLGAAALATRRDRDEERAPLDASWRVPLAVGVLAVAVTPVLITISQARLTTAADSFGVGDCDNAVTQALDATEVLAVRPEPYEIVGYCQVQSGFAQQGVQAMEKAVDREPGNWEYHYGLAVARAAAGLDPRPAADRAHELNPREPIARRLATRLANADSGSWPDEAERGRVAMYESGLLTLP